MLCTSPVGPFLVCHGVRGPGADETTRRRKACGQSALPVIPAPVAIVRVRIIGSVLLTLGLPVYRALADVCLSQLTRGGADRLVGGVGF